MSNKLDLYNQKRDFGKTSEPRGGKEEGVGLRFVVQHHLARNDHYDFRLEWRGVLLSWAIPKGPSLDTLEKRLAIQVEDHPLDYKDFEGTIPKGEYGGGTVMLWDEGLWQPQGDVDKGLTDGSIKFSLEGVRLKGKWALVRLKQKDDGDKGDNWLLIKEKDEYALPESGISAYNTSVRTGRTMSAIESGAETKLAANPFDKADVQLAKLVGSIPKGDDMLYELKYDGYRIVAFVENNMARLMTRNDKDYTKHFKSVAASLVRLANGRAMVLDGEMVCTDDDGKSNFGDLQSYIKNPKGKSITYIIFDLLALDGKDIRPLPLVERKEKLQTLMQNPPANLHFSRHIQGKGEESFAAACDADMEGIIGKKANSPYRGTRNGDWIKIKCDNRQEFVVGGYTLSDKKTEGVSSLLLGYYDGKDLIFVGRAGSGISGQEGKALAAKFESIKRQDSPFANPPKPKKTEDFFWLEPQMVAEVRFAEWTSDNLLRQPSYKGMRTDKSPKDVVKEATEPKTEEETDKNGGIVIGGVKITNPDRVVFDNPKTTKADIVRYYAKVAPRMLPYVGGRILSIVRCPKGIEEACFFKKHPDANKKGIIGVPISNSDGGQSEYFYIDDAYGLISEAQMGTLEFHTWCSRVETLENPDMMVFDLDPDEGMELSSVRRGVDDLRKVLDELSLNPYLKTSGGKGYHVVVPFEPSASWDGFYDFAKRVAQVMEQRWGSRYTSNSRKQKRAGKIFIDWIRNGRGATSVAPYSLRARKGAKVSMPISWEELGKIDPDGIDMSAALERLEGKDPWQDFFANRAMLKQ